MEKRILLRLHHVPNIQEWETYAVHGGYQALSASVHSGPEKILRMVEDAGLRGRGGAGFPAAVKWRSVRQQSAQPHYFVCNIAEGEPGSFKDRELLRNPHQVIETTAIASLATGAAKAFIYLRGAFSKEEKILRTALEQASANGMVGPGGKLQIEMIIHRGEDSYIAGEETALLESLEGKPAIPRTKPPRPHEFGLWGYPTAVSNVETICNLIPIILEGPEAFRKNGTSDSPGTKLFCLSGQIKRPGIYEAPMGVKLSALLEECGKGPLPGRRLKAVFPGGPSTPILSVESDPVMDFEGVRKAGSHLGTGGIIVLDDSMDPLRTSVEISSFFERECCRACPPCTIGTAEVHRLFQEMQSGQDKPSRIKQIKAMVDIMKYRGQCAHCPSAATSTLSLLTCL